MCKLLISLVIATFLACPLEAGTVLFESGTLGQTGVVFSDLGATVPGTNISDSVFGGVRLLLDQPVTTTEVGGHFVGASSGSFFGAIVELSDENDFPDSQDLSSTDVAGLTLLFFPVSSNEVYGELSLQLDSGWYALIFGSGLFGATTNGGAVRNGGDLHQASYFVLGPNFGWIDVTTFPNHRFVIHGDVVPEPFALLLLAIGLVTMLSTREEKGEGKKRRKGRRKGVKYRCPAGRKGVKYRCPEQIAYPPITVLDTFFSLFSL